MNTQSETPESKNTSSPTPSSSLLNKMAEVRKAKPRKEELVKITFLVQAQLELAFRLAAIQLEIAKEPIHKHNDMGNEMLKRYLETLSRNKKANFSSLSASAPAPSESELGK
jgi:hypothetical protein